MVGGGVTGGVGVHNSIGIGIVTIVVGTIVDNDIVL